MAPQSTNVSIKGYEVLDASGPLIKARHTNLDRVVSLRVIDESAGSEEIEHFLEVARTVAKIHHPNIVAVSDAGTCPDSGLHYMAMEYVGDQTLARIIDEEGGGLGEADALAVTQAIAEALICLEEHGISHGDIRPANVLVDNDGTPKLAELGFGVRTGDETNTDSWNYMAPELFAGQAPDSLSDLYSLGCTLFCLLAGRAPYTGETQEDYLETHTLGNFPDAHEHGASDELTSALLGLVSVNPSKRYQGALKANLDLVRVMTGHPPDGPSGANSASRGSSTDTFKPIRLEEGTNSIPVEDLAGPVFKIRLLSRNQVLDTFEFDKDLVTIGRGAASDIHIDNPIISRKHAKFTREHGGVLIHGLSSTNSTAVDGEQIKGAKALAPGSTVVLSDKFHLEVTWSEAPDVGDPHNPLADADDKTPVVGTRTVPKQSDPAPKPAEPDNAPTPVVGTKRPAAITEPTPEAYDDMTATSESGYDAPVADTPSPYASQTAEPSPYASQPSEPSPYAEAGPYASPGSDLAGASQYGDAGGDYVAPETESVRRPRAEGAKEFTESGLRKIFAPPQGFLVFERKGRQIRSFVDKGFQVGASSACDLRLPKGSPRKAALIVRGVDAYRLYNVAPAIDMATLNGEPVPDRAVLEDGDVIEVCGVSLYFSLEDG